MLWCVLASTSYSKKQMRMLPGCVCSSPPRRPATRATGRQERSKDHSCAGAAAAIMVISATTIIISASAQGAITSGNLLQQEEQQGSNTKQRRIMCVLCCWLAPASSHQPRSVVRGVVPACAPRPPPGMPYY